MLNICALYHLSATLSDSVFSWSVFIDQGWMSFYDSFTLYHLWKNCDHEAKIRIFVVISSVKNLFGHRRQARWGSLLSREVAEYFRSDKRWWAQRHQIIPSGVAGQALPLPRLAIVRVKCVGCWQERSTCFQICCGSGNHPVTLHYTMRQPLCNIYDICV